MKRILLIAFSILISFVACKKNDSDDPNESVLDYMPLKVGNYWVYETYSCDSGEVNCESISIDTNWVTGDTLINGEVYYMVEGKLLLVQGTLFLRDSGEYLVDHHGSVLFTHTDSLQIFNPQSIKNPEGDTIYYWYSKLTAQNGHISTGAGSFNCMNMRGSFFTAADDFQQVHHYHNYYAKNVGLVKQTSFFASNFSAFRRELIDYHLE
jgi:hypothetical protein